MFSNELLDSVPTQDALNNKSLTSQAFDLIRIDILKGILKPDERLRIQNLSERYKVGATAIREALSRLVTSGFVESTDQRGFNVAPVSRTELLDLTQTRIDVESLALRRAIENGDVEWESRVISSFHKLSKFHASPLSKEGLDGWSMAHRQFHNCLLAGCNSEWLLNICDLLYERSERYRNLSILQADPAKNNLLAEERAKDVLFEHKELMEAAINRNAPKATDLLSKHFSATTNIILNADNPLLALSRRTQR